MAVLLLVSVPSLSAHGAPVPTGSSPGGPIAPTGPGASPSPLDPGATARARVLDLLDSGMVPAHDLFLPNLAALGTHPRSGATQPLEQPSPAPMGVSDLGLTWSNGSRVSQNVTTSSVQGGLNLSSVAPFNLVNSGPFTFGVQLNTVLSNVTVEGNGGYTFWTQNVAEFSPDTGELELVNN
ncbi:MAG: thermopsin family protease, partial [Thermoplasmata archaeon]